MRIRIMGQFELFNPVSKHGHAIILLRTVIMTNWKNQSYSKFALV